jgi:drug/metabolite transporter (DMT)-like permease
MVLLAEQPGLRKWIGIALAFAGVGLIAGEPRFDGAWLSMLMVVGGAFTWALGQVLVRKLKDIDGLTVTAWIAVCATPQLFVMSAIFETGHIAAIETAGLVVWGAVAYLGVIMTALGYGMWYTLLRRHPVHMVGPFLLLLPVFAGIGGVVFLGEVLTTTSLIGGAIVITGVGLITIEHQPHAVAAHAAARDTASYSWPDGSRYDGEWHDGLMHGTGTMIWGAGTNWPDLVYEGEWQAGRPTGSGVYHSPDGTRTQVT